MGNSIGKFLEFCWWYEERKKTCDRNAVKKCIKHPMMIWEIYRKKEMSLSFAYTRVAATGKSCSLHVARCQKSMIIFLLRGVCKRAQNSFATNPKSRLHDDFYAHFLFFSIAFSFYSIRYAVYAIFNFFSLLAAFFAILICWEKIPFNNLFSSLSAGSYASWVALHAMTNRLHLCNCTIRNRLSGNTSKWGGI